MISMDVQSNIDRSRKQGRNAGNHIPLKHLHDVNLTASHLFAIFKQETLTYSLRPNDACDFADAYYGK